jgi:hypothetical protein
MAIYKGFPLTPYMPNFDSVCHRGEVFAKHTIIAFPAIFELVTRFVPLGPNFCSRPSYCPRVEVENFVTFTSRCCVL